MYLYIDSGTVCCTVLMYRCWCHIWYGTYASVTIAYAVLCLRMWYCAYASVTITYAVLYSYSVEVLYVVLYLYLYISSGTNVG